MYIRNIYPIYRINSKFINYYDEKDVICHHYPPFVPPENRNPETGKASFNMDNWLEFANRADEMERHNGNEARVRTGPVGLGFRVPTLVISPWSRGGYVNTQDFDYIYTFQQLDKVMCE